MMVNDDTVYPRVGGGTPVAPASNRPMYGLSPRRRGNPGGTGVKPPYVRSIPA